MIRVVYARNACTVTAEGHAQSGKYGHDLVCAAASVLAYTLAQNIEEAKAAGRLKSADILLSPGRAVLRCTPHPQNKPALQQTLDAVCAGYALLARQYPENLSFEKV